MIHQDPLAYLPGLEGIALPDARAEDHDRAFTGTRLAKIRRLLAGKKLRDRSELAERASTVTAYKQQSASYDAEAGAGRSLPKSRSWPGTSAAGSLTCRWTPHTEPAVSPNSSPAAGIRSSASTPHRTCPPARRRVPDGESRLAALDQLPLPDDSAGVIACGPALVHVPGLRPVLAEFARLLRPGGDLVISDLRHELLTRGSVIKARGPAGEPCIAATCRHRLGDYLRAALSLGFQVRRCQEPGAAQPVGPLPEPATGIGDWQDWPWSLMDYLPSAARAAGGCPSLVIWHFQLPAA